MLDGLESLDPGVLESWSIGVLKKRYQTVSRHSNLSRRSHASA